MGADNIPPEQYWFAIAGLNAIIIFLLAFVYIVYVGIKSLLDD